ncbi:MAG TPA: hypothetical protein VGU45_04945 [Microvirga sp.]|jgi:hypothetical protein|nr:hypothetical protein [Microvirga sp.]
MYDEQSPIVRALKDAVASMQAVASSMEESMGAQRLPGSGTYAFRRTTDPLLVPVTLDGSEYTVPAGFFDEGGPGFGTTSFYIVNRNPCFVRLRGTSKQHKTFQRVTPETGWCFSPGNHGPFSTQYPVKMSAMFAEGLPAPATFLPIEVSYGGGA